MNIYKISTLLCASALLFTVSCQNDDEIPAPKGAYDKGIFVSNEGNFGKPNASISYISADGSSIENNVFQKNNSGENLGDVLQDVGFYGNSAYMVLNNSNKIVVADRYSMKKQAEITTEVKQPRYIAFSNNQFYVTNSSSVSIFKTSDNSFVKKIALNDTAERIVAAGDGIFVQNASYGYGNKITYIKGDAVQSVITLPDGQLNKIVTTGANVYAISADSANSYIYNISSNGTILKTITIAGIPDATNLEVSSGKFYFTSKNKIYSMDIASSETPKTPIITVTNNSFSTLYGFNVINDKIYTSDANGFTAASKISVYSLGGVLLKKYEAGMGANGFYKN